MQKKKKRSLLIMYVWFIFKEFTSYYLLVLDIKIFELSAICYNYLEFLLKFLGKDYVKELYPFCIKFEISESKDIKPNANFLVTLDINSIIGPSGSLESWVSRHCLCYTTNYDPCLLSFVFTDLGKKSIWETFPEKQLSWLVMPISR